MKAKDFDKKFESGEDLANQFDFSKARRVNQESKRVNIDRFVGVSRSSAR
jgi:hypothetical protein